MSKRWNDNELSTLFDIAIKELNSTNQFKLLEDSEIFDSIFKNFEEIQGNSNQRSLGAIKSKLSDSDSGFDLIKKSHKDNCFFKNKKLPKPNSKFILNYYFNPKFPKFTKKHKDIIIDSIKYYEIKNNSISINKLCSEISKNLNYQRNQEAIHFWLYCHNFIFLNDNLDYFYTKKTTLGSDQMNQFEQMVNSKEMPENKKEKINQKRKKLSNLFSNNKNSLVLCSDGTGYGKTYGAIMAFIEEIKQKNKNEHINLLFSSPQKNHLSIDDKLIEKAQENNIELIYVNADEEIKNPSSYNIFLGNNTKKIYSKWKSNSCFRKTKLKHFKTDIVERLHSNACAIEAKQKDLDNTKEEEIKNDIKKDIDDYKNQQMILKDRFLKYLTEYLNKNLKNFNNLNDFFLSKENQILFEMLKFFAPFEACKYKTSILVCTTKKITTKNNYVIEANKKQSDQWIAKKYPVIDIISGKKRTNEMCSNQVGKPEKDQIEFIRQNLFENFQYDYFHDNNIYFNWVIDEEHQAYDMLTNNSYSHIVPPQKLNLPHILSSMQRYINALDEANQDNEDIEEDELLKEYDEFIKTIEDTMDECCDIRNNIDLKKIISMFQNSATQIMINLSDLENVMNITKNIFSFSPKSFINKNELKSILMKSKNGGTKVLLYSQDDQNDNNLNLYEFYQIAMCILLAASKVRKNGEFQQSVKNYNDQGNQNIPMANLLNSAHEHRDKIDFMFDRVIDENASIDDFFVYTQPKTFFSIRQLQKNENNAINIENVDSTKVEVDLNIQLVTSLPENFISQVLDQTNNNIILLSATTGFHSYVNGNFNRRILEKYSNHGMFSILDREKENQDNLKTIQDLRDLRSNYRKVRIKHFSDNACQIKEPQNNLYQDKKDEYVNELKQLGRYNSNYHIKYKQRELNTIVDALLSSAFDNKNSLVLCLSSDFHSAVDDYFKQENMKSIDSLGIQSKNQYNLFHCMNSDLEDSNLKYRLVQLTPFKNRPSIKLILFNADLGKKVEKLQEQFMKIQSSDEVIVFISPYASAGTGLNYFVNYELENETKEFDFDRLVLVNDIPYSSIFSSNDNDLSNKVVVLKSIVEEPEKVELKNLDVDTHSYNNIRRLRKEHEMEIFKSFIQAVGRIERRDATMKSEIYMPNSVFKKLALMYHSLSNKKENNTIIQSESLFANQLRIETKEYIESNKYTNKQDRQHFENKIKNKKSKINFFLNDNDSILKKSLQKAHQTNKIHDFLKITEFNERLRSIKCLTNPEEYINDIKKCQYFKENIQNTNYKKALDDFFVKEEIVLCEQKSNPCLLTDLDQGEYLYEPERKLCPSLIPRKKQIQDNITSKIIDQVNNLSNEEYTKCVPHPALIPLFKGNIGEYLFKQTLDELNINYLSNQQIFNVLTPELYELSDFFITNKNDNKNNLLCIDVKNWSPYSDHSNSNESIIEKIEQKKRSINKYASGQFDTIKFIYVNTFFDNNPLNKSFKTDKSSSIYFFNLFKQYENKIGINNNLIEILKG